MKVNINKMVMGSLTDSAGYDHYLYATKGEADTDLMWKFCELFRRFSNCGTVDHRKESQYPRFWFIPGKEKIFLLLYQDNYTQFPNKSRYYDQKIFSWFNSVDIRELGIGNVFSSAKLFKQYDSKDKKSRGTCEIDITKEKFSVSEELIRRLALTVDEDKKLLIQMDTDGLELYANEITDFLPFKKLFYALQELPFTKQKQISISTATRHDGSKIGIKIGEKQVTIPAEEAYYYLWDGCRASDSSLFGKICYFFGKAEYKSAIPEKKEMHGVMSEVGFEYFGSPNNKVLIMYDKLTERQKDWYQKDGYEIVGEEIFQ